MVAASNISGLDRKLPPEPALTGAEIIDRAGAIAATLIDRQAETEQRTYYAQDTHEAFRNAGLYRILVPRRFGGYEFDVETFFRVVMKLARGCPSTGWMYCLGASHAMIAATFYDAQAQAELFSSGEFISPATIVPAGSARRTDDGWLINGRWPYSSGTPYATHCIHHTLIADGPRESPTPMMFVTPRSEFRYLDDWGSQLGLRGSGSHTITIDDGRIPDNFALPGMHLSEATVRQGTPGRHLHGNPQYGGGPLSFMMLESATLAVGMAQGALDAYGELMRTRTTVIPPLVSRTADPDFQFWYGDATGMIDAAEAAVLGAIHRWRALSEGGPNEFDREADLRISGICRHAIALAWRAVERYLVPTAGSSAVRQGERVERIWRDMSMMHTHTGLQILAPTVATRQVTQAQFGLT